MRNPRTTLLASVSGELVSGELTAILGQSGAGKSTMLRALAQAPMPLGIDINGAVLADGKLVLGRMSDAYAMSEEEDYKPYDLDDEHTIAAASSQQPAQNERPGVGSSVELSSTVVCAADNDGTGNLGDSASSDYLRQQTPSTWPHATVTPRTGWGLLVRRVSNSSTLSSDSSQCDEESWWSRARYLTHMVFMEQTDALLCPFLSARENVYLYATLRCPQLTRSRAAETAALVLEDVGLKRSAWSRRVGSGTGADSQLSGGERRKTVLACQLAAEPSIVLADEPTSGLDSSSAADVVGCLSRYAGGASTWCAPQRRIVALTIHQPSSALFDLFDRVIVVSEGRIAWTGTPRTSMKLDVVRAVVSGETIEDVIRAIDAAGRGFNEEEEDNQQQPHLEDGRASIEVLSQATTPRGVVGSLAAAAIATVPPLPEASAVAEAAEAAVRAKRRSRLRKRREDDDGAAIAASPADVLVSLPYAALRASAHRASTRLLAEESQRYREKSSHDQQRDDTAPGSGGSSLPAATWEPPPRALRRPVLWLSFRELFLRELRSVVRRPALFITHIAAAAVLGVMLGLVYYDVPNTLPGVINRMGAFFFFASLWGFAGMSAVDPSFESRYRDQNGLLNFDFPAFSLLVARILADSLLLRILPTFVYGAVFYPLMGLRSSYSAFLVFAGLGALYSTNMGVLAMLVAVLSPSMGVATLVGSIVILFMILFGGFLVNPSSMPPIALALRQLSPFYQTFTAFLLNELKDNPTSFTLDVEVGGAWTSIEGVKGNTFLSVVGVDRRSSVLRHGTALWLHTLFLIVLLYLALRLCFVPGRRWK